MRNIKKEEKEEYKCSVCERPSWILCNSATLAPISNQYCKICIDNNAESVYYLLRILQLDYIKYANMRHLKGYVDGVYIPMSGIVSIYDTLKNIMWASQAH